jgi:hypothetical protein
MLRSIDWTVNLYRVSVNTYGFGWTLRQMG